MQRRCPVDLWTAGYAGSRLTAPARSPMDKPWTTLRVAHRLPTGRRLPTSSTALDPIDIKSGQVKTNTPAPALAYSCPVAVQTTGTTASICPNFRGWLYSSTKWRHAIQWIGSSWSLTVQAGMPAMHSEHPKTYTCSRCLPMPLTPTGSSISGMNCAKSPYTTSPSIASMHLKISSNQASKPLNQSTSVSAQSYTGRGSLMH